METIAVGLSGGVDSKLTALLLKEQGYHVVGLSMSIYNRDIPNMTLSRKSCYGPTEKQDIRDIQKWAETQGIESHILDLSEPFKKTVFSYFKESYLSGNTPNPCILCNTTIKFGLLIDSARAQGIKFDAFATGHYARILNKNNKYILQKGLDNRKDQSYFLYRLTQAQLSQTLFPLGGYTKEEVRQMARERGLIVADKADSQDFYGGDYADLLEQSPKQGDIVLTSGKKIGIHQGFWNYTIGQRKGLGIAYPEPLYVVDIDASQNRVIVGTSSETLTNNCHATHLVFGGLMDRVETPLRVMAKYRSAGQPVPAIMTQQGDTINVCFDTPQKAITRGQSIVFYDGDNVLAGGIIA